MLCFQDVHVLSKLGRGQLTIQRQEEQQRDAPKEKGAREQSPPETHIRDAPSQFSAAISALENNSAVV